ncbi:MAG: histidine ammonia-lyase [Schleiferiaceae bacterium]|nr:histidine ammonia-lyase [Schleiferiaceae bacterium]
MKQLTLSQAWQLEDWATIASGIATIDFDKESRHRVQQSHSNMLKVLNQGQAVYGINTGFGSLCTTAIPHEELQDLQVNLLRSHAAGTGPNSNDAIVRLMLVAKAKSLAQGFSGIRPVLIDQLLALYHADVLPVVPQIGSLGASGDLAPLSHLCLPLIGESKVNVGTEIMDASKALSQVGISPIVLEAKEGLALINGTQFMLANGLHVAMEAQRVSYWADLIGSASALAYEGSSAPFQPGIHKVRKQAGQSFVASRVLEFTLGAADFQIATKHVQDPYSFRCMPQVHGASNDAWLHIEKILLDEGESVTDNPTVFEDAILSAGNFHGQPLAMAMDYGKLALAEWGSISERRINQLMLGKRGLPPFLAANAGTESGYMILQYSAAALVSRSKQRSVPASTDSIDSSAGQEDHVSMGANASTDAIEILNNTWTILSMEFLAAMRAHGLNSGLMSPIIKDLRDAFMDAVQPASGDGILAVDMEATKQFIQSIDIEDRLAFNA